MTNKKSTKRALMSSIVSLMLCFSMLLGTTYAWFTDSVTSANNIITAGNLDVELEYWNEATKKYEPVTNEIALFDSNALWEPGHTEVAYLKVSNAGSLALKYQLQVNIYDEITGLTKDDDEIKLSDHLVFSVVEKQINSEADLYTREEAIKDAGNSKGLKAYYGETKKLDPKKDDGSGDTEDYVALIIYMPETVENEANHNGINIPKIEMGVNLFATQVEAEEDGFGSDYDKDSLYTDVIVTSEEELKTALANAKDFDVIGIKGNVTWTTGAGIGSTPFIENVMTATTEEAVAAKHITLLGLEEGATFTALGAGVGAIGIDGGSVTFKNLKIVDNSESYKESSWEFGYLEFRGNTVFENCDIVNAIMMEGESATFKNCSFNSNKNSEYAIWVSEGNASFENCYFTGTRGIKIHEAYGSEVDTVVVKNNEFADLTEKPALAIGTVNADTTVVIQNNMVAGAQAGDQGLYIYETDTDVTTFDFVCADNTVAGYADTNAELKDQLQNNATVVLPDGEYSLPSLSGKEGITIIGAADGSTVVGGENTATGFGSNFGKNTTIKNVTFTGSTNGVRWSYAQGGTSTFENCTFAGDSTYGFHIDQSNGATFIFNNCTFSGFNAFAGDLEKVVFNNCTFLHNGNYGHTNIWSVAEFNNCTWTDKTSVSGGKLFFNGSEMLDNATSEGLQNALASGDADLYLPAGEYKMPSSGTNGDINITGTKDTVLDMTNGAYLEGANVTIEGVTIKTCTGKVNGNGSDYAALYTPNVTYINCTFVGPMRVGRDGAKFINCTFTGLGNDYVWTYGNDVTFEGCTFNTDGKAILIYSDGGNEVAKVTVKNCTFNSTTGAKAGAIANQNCAAIEIHNYGNGVDLVTEGNTYDSNFSGEWRIKTYETGRTKVFVNGTEYTTIAIDGKTMTIDGNKNVTVNN